MEETKIWAKKILTMNNTRVIVVLIVLLLVACSSTETEVVVVAATPEPLPTDTPKPPSTSTPLPTDTPAPTFTPTSLPTDTPAPTFTPTSLPTDTPAPTSTPTPLPTDTPTPTSTPTPLPTDTPTPTSTVTPENWMTYEHIRDRKLDYCSDMSNDFSIELPPKWVVVTKTCNSVTLEPRTEGADIEVVIEHLPNYNSNPELAIVELAEDLGEDYTTETLIGHRLDVVVDSTVKTTHQEEPALSQRMTLTAPNHSFYYCVTKEDRLIVLSKFWRTDKNAFFITGARCKDDTSNYSDMVRAMKSFQMISP